MSDKPPVLLQVKLNEVKIPIASFIADRYNSWPLGLTLLLNIIHWILILRNIQFSSGSLILHYNVVSGADVVGRETWLYLMPLLAFLELTVNVVAARSFYAREKVAAYFLNLGSIAVQLIFLAASLSLLAINEL